MNFKGVMNVDNTEKQRIISFCTGYAGIELGLERAGVNIKPVAYVEREGYVCANLVSKIEQGKLGAAPIFTDVKTFPARYFSGKVHGIIGGYPCQPFSTAGKRCGTDDPRHLWPYILQHIRTIRPIWCLFENVSGHLTLGYEKVQEDLHEAGYLVEAGLFTAAEVGASHKRERLFILAYSADCGNLRESRHVCKEDGGQGRTLQRQFIGSGILAYSQSTERKHAGITRSGGNGLTNQSMAYSEQQRLRGRGDGIPAGVCGQVQIERPSELGNAEHDGLFTGQKRASIEERNGSEQAGAFSTSKFERPDIERKELGNTEDLRLQEQCKTGREQVEFDGTNEELADTGNEGLQGLRECDKPQGRQTQTGHIGSSGELRQSRYPARPGQPQYDWEEPRTLEREVGRTDDEHTTELDECVQVNTWVDEIRMCGNGVVPDVAALAWTTLTKRLGVIL